MQATLFIQEISKLLLSTQKKELIEEIGKKAFVIKHHGAIDLDISPVVKLEDLETIITNHK